MGHWCKNGVIFMQPLADKIRPNTLEEVIGQSHLVGEGKVIRNMFNKGYIPNMIFYGPPGVGKTTVANLAAKATNKKFYKLNATTAGVKDIQNIISELDSFMTMNGAVLYLDEIQNFNKKQQQSLLEFMENGKLTLIASTTENPYHYVYNALLSRSLVFEFKSLCNNDIVKGLKRAKAIIENELNNISIECSAEVFEGLANFSGGDLRKAINTFEGLIYSTDANKGKSIEITSELLKESAGIKGFNYDKNGDNHYDILSAFQKSIRGSDENAALHYLARLIKSGDLISICRRLLVMASEDIGLAYPNAITIVKSCTDAAMQLGFPEARIPLAQAVILLATAPKSNSAYSAVDRALRDIEELNVGEIPLYLRDAHYKGAEKLGRGVEYRYPHGYPNNYVNQQYLPDNIKERKYYEPGNNKYEKATEEYWKKIKK